MNWTATALALVAACSFVPGGDRGGEALEDAAAAAADAAADASGPDARSVDARLPVDAGPIDAATLDAPIPPIDGRAPCPTGYDRVHNGGRYALRHVAQLYGLAVADCLDDLLGRTHLATFENPADLTPTLRLLDPGNHATVFVGATCLSPTLEATCAASGSWSWGLGPAVDPTLWAPGQPDGPVTDTAAQVRREGMDWRLDNVSAVQTRPYVCECDP